MSSAERALDRRERSRHVRAAVIWRTVLWVSGLGALVCLLLLVLWTYQIASEAHPPESLWLILSHEGEQSSLYEQSSALVWAFVLCGLLAWIAYAWPRRHSPKNTGVVVALCIAGSTMILAAATYLPCRPHTSDVVPPLAWVLSTFEGDYELAGPGARCSLAFPPGFELARALAFLLIIFGATAVIRVFARQSIDRWKVSCHSDVDVVVGLDQHTLPLVKALARERDGRHRLEQWVEPRPGWLLRLSGASRSGERGQTERHLGRVGPYTGVSTFEYWLWWLTGLRRNDWRHILRRRTAVVVIDLNKDNALIGEIRRMRVRVVVGDATDPETLRLVTHRTRLLPPRRVSLRRLYAVTRHQRTNLLTFETAKELLASGRKQSDHVDDVIPRLFVRMDSTREARQWRLEQLQGLDGVLFADAITPVGIAASFVAARVIPATEWLPSDDSITHVLLVGESSLALALLDELAWQQWIRYEVALYRFEQLRATGVRGAEMEKAKENLMRSAAPALQRVSLLGPNPRVRTREWAATRAPWNAGTSVEHELKLFTVQGESNGDSEQYWRQAEDHWESVAELALSDQSQKALVVFVDASDSYEAAASRLARSHSGDGASAVLLRVDEQGSWPTPVTRGGVQRFVASLVHNSDEGDEAPADSVMRLARQQHTVYREQWPAAPDTGAAAGACDKSLHRRARVTDVDWRELPRFFQEDNIRQHWHVLNWFAHAEDGSWEWRRITGNDAREAESGSAGRVPEDVLDDVARSESSRWNELRRRHGWWLVSSKEYRNDPQRLTDRLTDWDEKSRDGKQGDRNLISLILRRLWATGLMPARPDQSRGSQTTSNPSGRNEKPAG